MPRACVLITGCEGFIGRNLFPHLLARDLEVIGVDDSLRSSRFRRLRTLQADVLDPRGLSVIGGALGERQAEELHTVHLAGLSHVATCEADPVKAHDLNVRSVQRVCDLVAEHGGRRFVLPSTVLVYGSQAQDALDEEAPTNPGSVYAKTKREAEIYLLEGDLGASIEPVVLRMSSVYGPGMHPDTLMPTIQTQLEEGDLHLSEYCSVRDYLYVTDAVCAFEAVLFGACRYPLYNVGTGRGASILEIAKVFARILGKEEVVARVPRPKSYGPVLVLSDDRIRRDLGWEPEYSLERGVADMLSIEAKE